MKGQKMLQLAAVQTIAGAIKAAAAAIPSTSSRVDQASNGHDSLWVIGIRPECSSRTLLFLQKR